jgi:hypothetical protein
LHANEFLGTNAECSECFLFKRALQARSMSPLHY